MKFLPVLVVACVVSQAAFAEGLECRRVSDPTPHLSCVEKPATAEVPNLQRPDEVSPSGTSRRDSPSDRNNDGVTSRTTRICRNC
jgi:hypothetical protein